MTNENVENAEIRGDLGLDSRESSADSQDSRIDSKADSPESTPKLSLSEFLARENLQKINGKYKPNNKQLKELVRYDEVHLGDIDTSEITSMNRLFENSTRTKEEFSGIEKWDTSNVTSFAYAFSRAEHFDSDISGWNVEKGKGFYYMFFHAHNFNQPIGAKWHTKSAKNMRAMFCFATKFNNGGQDFGKDWVMDNVDLSAEMFYNTDNFNAGGLNKWNMTNIKKCWSMFRNARAFDKPLDEWNMPNCSGFFGMFYGAESFNQNLSAWGDKLGKVKNMENMFADTKSLNQTFDWKINENCNTTNITKNSPLQLNITYISDSGAEGEKEILQDSSQNALVSTTAQSKRTARDISYFRIYKIDKIPNNLNKFNDSNDRKSPYKWIPENIKETYNIFLAKKVNDAIQTADESQWDFIFYEVLGVCFVVEIDDNEFADKSKVEMLNLEQKIDKDDFDEFNFKETNDYRGDGLEIVLEDSQRIMRIYNGDTNTANSYRILNIIGALILAKAYESKMSDFNKMARSAKGARLMKCHKEICEFDLHFYQNAPVEQNLSLLEFWDKISKRYRIANKHNELKETISRITQIVGEELREQENARKEKEKKEQDERRERADKARQDENDKRARQSMWLNIGMFFIGLLSLLGVIIPLVK